MYSRFTSFCNSFTCIALTAHGASLLHGQQVSPEGFSSSNVCGECHQAIHAVWQHSMHARAYVNGVFQAAYKETARTHSELRAQLCLQCHAPTVRHTRDYVAAEPVTREGVTCDFCHSIRGVDPHRSPEGAVFDVGRTKYGPLKHAQSPAHEVVDSELHRRSELCAACHEYRNSHGVAILETYSEWKTSPYAQEGRQCQDCHMPIIPGRVVGAGLDAPRREGVNLHNISGSHDIERVRGAITMSIRGAAWMGENSVGVRIGVANVGSGHYFPTGLPLHRAVLEVRLTNHGFLVGRRTFSFEKELVDGNGLLITREGAAFFDARSVRKDTRLKPKENRTIQVSFYDVEASDAQVEARLWYQYSAHTVVARDGVESIEPVEMKILLASDKQRVAGVRR